MSQPTGNATPTNESGLSPSRSSPSLIQLLRSRVRRLSETPEPQRKFLRSLERAVANRVIMEQVHRLRNAVILAGLRERERSQGITVALTGPRGGEGASVLHMLLGLSLAECTERGVSVLDGRFEVQRFQSLTRLFQLSRNAVNLASTSTEVVGYCNEGHPNAHFLHGESVERGLEFFSDKKLKGFFEQLRQSFDFTVIDMPPLLQDTSTCFVLPYVDVLYLVVEAGRTRFSEVEQCMKTVNDAGFRISGVVVNKQAAPFWSRFVWRDFFF